MKYLNIYKDGLAQDLVGWLFNDFGDFSRNIVLALRQLQIKKWITLFFPRKPAGKIPIFSAQIIWSLYLQVL